MKKIALIFTLAMVIAMVGCSKEETNETKGTENTSVAKEESVQDKDTSTKKPAEEDETSDKVESKSQVDENSDSEVTSQNKNSDDKKVEAYDRSKLDAYMTSVDKKSKSINDYIENDAMTQADMNTKSKELYDLWDEALNYVWKELEKALDEDEFTKLKADQRKWVTDKENKVKEAGKEYEGGSLYALTVNSEGAKLTEERVRELYKKVK